MGTDGHRKIVIVNQAANYLTVGLANAFLKSFTGVALITGSVHVQGEELKEEIVITKITRWKEDHGFGKVLIYLKGLFQIYYLLLTRYREYEVLFISLPPMGYLLNLFLFNRFSMLIWDVYPDAFRVTGMTEQHIMYKVWASLNKKSFRKAHRLFTIGDKIAEKIAHYVDKDKINIQPIWSVFQENSRIEKSLNPFIRKHQLEGKFVVQYSGNIGLSHRVEVIVSLAERLQDSHNIFFQIIGRGPRVPHLKKLVSEKSLKNCQFLPFQSDEIFPYSLSAADVGVVILDGINALGSVPSKSYNLMSFGIPSLYIAPPQSELKMYADNFGHARCFEEQNLNDAAKFILALSDDKKLYNQYADNSIRAAGNFKRSNADKLVERYLKPEEFKQETIASGVTE